MKQSPLVSIIIDNYNYGRFLRDAIDSALKQTYQHVEVIVVDDGSTDESPAIITDYGDIITAVLKDNGGQASAFNKGFDVSQGEIIVFLDSDDVLLPTALENVVQNFDSLAVAKLHWPLWRVDGSGKRSGGIVPAHPLAEGDMRDMLVQKGPSYFCGTAYSSPSGNSWSRKFLEQVFPLPEADFKTGGADFFLSVLSPVYGLTRKIDEPQGCYRVHGSNDTLKSPDAYLHTFFGWYEQASQALQQHLTRSGIAVNTNNWKRDSWYHQIHESLQEIGNIVPVEEGFILVDGNDWGTTESVAGRYRIRFIEQDGQYWGPPADDAVAIKEIEKQRERGVNFIFFVWSTFWWLEHYPEMYSHLKSNYKCVISNNRLLGFNLELTTELNNVGILSHFGEM